MQLTDTPTRWLVYCLNIHPGETWPENMASIEREAAEVRRRIAPDRPFGLGLRISARAARTLADPRRRAAAARRFADLGMRPVTINGFPYGRFHRERVKERVYAPDWRSEARLAYTLRLAEILASWLPEGGDGSISTVPASYGPWIRSDRSVTAMVRRLARLAASLDELRRRTGREIHVALEPEPDCLIETTAGLVEFFERRLLPQGSAALGGMSGMAGRQAESLLRRHLGVCLDTCHACVNGERPAEALARLERAGVRVSKIQISAAPRARNTDPGRRALSRFADPVYLHQTRAWDGSLERARWSDLPAALVDLRSRPRHWDVRTHCHIPLFHRPAAPLGTTAEMLDDAFWRAAVRLTSVLEIETYTFFALPAAVRRPRVVDSIVAEHRWCLRRLRLALRGGVDLP